VTVPHRVQGMSYTVQNGEPVSTPQVAYTPRSVAVFTAVAVVLVVGLGLIVAGCWAQWGWAIGLIALGAALIGALLLVAAWPTPKRGAQ
jgi:hypothetical protein